MMNDSCRMGIPARRLVLFLLKQAGMPFYSSHLCQQKKSTLAPTRTRKHATTRLRQGGPFSMSRDVQFSSRLSPFEYEYRFTEYEYDFCVKRLLGNKTIGMPVVRGTFSHEAAKFCTLILLICLAFISSSISNAQPSNSDSASSKDVANSNEVKSPPIDTQSSNSPTIIVVVGASGSATYEGLFRDWSKQWVDAAKRGKATIHTIGVDPSNGSKSDRDRLADVISEECQRGRRELW
ncbi:MAG: hypothetical protein FJ267_14725, partial [Planctomycetes bacterium]|nr:hypothetical protein [Planctomycetota bacterium]